MEGHTWAERKGREKRVHELGNGGEDGTAVLTPDQIGFKSQVTTREKGGAGDSAAVASLKKHKP